MIRLSSGYLEFCQYDLQSPKEQDSTAWKVLSTVANTANLAHSRISNFVHHPIHAVHDGFEKSIDFLSNVLKFAVSTQPLQMVDFKGERLIT